MDSLNATFLPTPEHAEAAFYDSFTNCDANGMQQVWGPDDIVCIHPGARPLIGFDQVMQSWNHIFGGGSSVDMRRELLSAHSSESLAVHVVKEVLSADDGEAVVLATNVYRRFSEGWKIVEHHASQPMMERLSKQTTAEQGITLQ